MAMIQDIRIDPANYDYVLETTRRFAGDIIIRWRYSMNKEEIVRHNIRECGYSPGRAIKGKGTEVISSPQYVVSGYNLDSCDNVLVAKDKVKIREAIEKHGKDNIFVKEIQIASKDGIKSYSFDDQYPVDTDSFPVCEILSSDFKDIMYLSLCTIPEVKTHVNMSVLDTTIESQQGMVTRLICDIEEKDIVDFVESQYDELDNQIIFSSSNRDGTSWEYNGDYTLFHGPSVCMDDSVVEHINGKMDNYNEAAVSDFWYLTMREEDPFSWDDPDGKVSVYARKEKDWYVTSGIEQEQLFLSYRDKDGELVEDKEFWYFANTATDELVNKVSRQVESMKSDLEVKAIINNGLHYGHWSDTGSSEDSSDIFNYKLLKKHFGEDGLNEVSYVILDYVKWDKNNKPERMVENAYEEYLLANIDDKGILFKKYKHLKNLREIVKQEGKELVYSQETEFSDIKRWAIKYKKEEYHFSLSELYNTGARKFYRKISTSIAKRKAEKIEVDIVMRKASGVFVSFADSLDSGNCESGTRSFCHRFNIDTNKIGGIRGDALLALDYSSFTRRAVAIAIKERG